MGILALMLAGIAVLPRSQAAVAHEPGSRSEWVYSLDLERARAIGWGTAESPPADVFRVAIGLLERRLRALDAGLGVEPAASELRVVLRSTAPFDEERSARLDSLVRSIGLAEFAIVGDVEVSVETWTRLLIRDLDLGSEPERLETWRRAHPEKTLFEFDALPFEQGGPHPSLMWLGEPQGGASVPFPILLPQRFDQAFGAADFERVYPAVDSIGYPAVGFLLKTTRRSEFRELTRTHRSRKLAVVLNEQVVSAPSIEEELPGEGIVRGRWTQEELDALIRRIQSLEGPFRPSS